ncbi:Uncharacterised protein [Streptococcus suis]|nr:Uncharacterised protein [Streptococcus suis]CYU19453.1 Uncharacterised protein [Streptococcus suis]CYW80915.1 Uncharacterised protein [Streptococcus suis]CYX40175.1 Uncharacterised protein [Streptococcus suis]CYX59902.1 Uncharacterised protein [Streptococcus suis]
MKIVKDIFIKRPMMWQYYLFPKYKLLYFEVFSIIYKYNYKIILFVCYF